MPQEDGTILIDKTHPVGSVICPSTLAKEPDLYAVRLMTDSLGTVIPQRSVLIIAPQAKIQDGDIVALPVGENRIRLGSAKLNANGTWCYYTAQSVDPVSISFDLLKSMQRVIYIAIP